LSARLQIIGEPVDVGPQTRRGNIVRISMGRVGKVRKLRTISLKPRLCGHGCRPAPQPGAVRGAN
jgi:hypothetical protein